MKFTVTKADVWMATIEDREGGAAEKLEPLAKAGANLEFILVHRLPEQAGKGVAYVAPIEGIRAITAAQDAGFEKVVNFCKLRIEGADQPGLCAVVTRAVANAGISLRGLTSTVIGGRFVAYLTLNKTQDAAKAMSVLNNLT